MKKYLIAGALALALPVLGMAATFSNVQFSNGDVTISGTGGSTTNATFRVIVPAGEVVENIQTTDGPLASVCTEVGGSLGLQEGTHDVTLSLKFPPNTGTYNVAVQGAGIYGGIRSISCTDNVVGSNTFYGALRVVADTNTSSDSTPPSWFATFWAAFLASQHPATPVPTASPACAEYATLSTGLSFGSDTRIGGRVGQLQSFLMGKGFPIQLLYEQKVPYGFYGIQTQGAATAFVQANHC